MIWISKWLYARARVYNVNTVVLALMLDPGAATQGGGLAWLIKIIMFV